MKRLKSIYNNTLNIVFGKSVNRFEEKLLLSSTLFVALFQFLSVVFNLMIGLKTSIIIVSIFGFFLFLTLYFVVRFGSRSNLVFLISGLIMLIFCDLIWLVNYGSWGPSIFFLIILFSFLILLFQRKYYFLITAVIILNLIGFFLIEYNFPNFIGSYTDQNSRISDTYTGSILSILFLLSLLAAIKKNYIHEFERAKMSDRLKSSFLANMSHEIRTPLNAIVGFSSLINEPEINEKEKEKFMEQIITNTDYLLSLIEDIIDVSKIESNQLTVKIRDFDVVPHIRQIVQTFQLAMPANKDVVVAANLDMTSLHIKIDPVRFEQIIRNLLSNALKFTEKGLIELSCKKENDFYIFSVKDTGIGIHIEHQKIIFDRFMKIENNKQHLYRGTGIGLFLSKQLVEMFDGEIWVESEVGKGSTFFFSIPA